MGGPKNGVPQQLEDCFLENLIQMENPCQLIIILSKEVVTDCQGRDNPMFFSQGNWGSSQ